MTAHTDGQYWIFRPTSPEEKNWFEAYEHSSRMVNLLETHYLVSEEYVGELLFLMGRDEMELR